MTKNAGETPALQVTDALLRGIGKRGEKKGRSHEWLRYQTGLLGRLGMVARINKRPGTGRRKTSAAVSRQRPSYLSSGYRSTALW